jgi:hypothetical protein
VRSSRSQGGCAFACARLEHSRDDDNDDDDDGEDAFAAGAGAAAVEAHP